MTIFNNTFRIATRFMVKEVQHQLQVPKLCITNIQKLNLHGSSGSRLTIINPLMVALPLSRIRCYSTKIDEAAAGIEVEAENLDETSPAPGGGGGGTTGTREQGDSDKDRTQIIPLETSLRYMQSDAYKETYGDTPVWVLYRRNFKGQFAPKKTRKTCIRQGKISTGNPCPICRDEYLVLDYRNVQLLKQFISPFNGEVLHWDKTGVCRRQQFNLLAAIQKAKDYGTITFDVKFREYNYEDYYSTEELEQLNAGNSNNFKLLEH